MSFIVDPRMRRELIKSIQRFFNEYKRSKTGMVGLIMLVLFVAISILYPVIGNPEIVDNWLKNPAYFDGVYPQRAPPCWVSKITGTTYSTRQVLGEGAFTQVEEWSNVKVLNPFTGTEEEVPFYRFRLEFTFRVDGQVPHDEITIEFRNISYKVDLVKPNYDPYWALVKGFKDAGFDDYTIALMLCPEKIAEIKTLDDVVKCYYAKELQKKLQEGNVTVEDLVKEGLLKRAPLNVTMLAIERPDGVKLEIVTPDNPVPLSTLFGTHPYEYGLRENQTNQTQVQAFKRIKVIEGILSKTVTVGAGGNATSKLLVSFATEKLFNVTIRDRAEIDLRKLLFGDNLTAVVVERRSDVGTLEGEYRFVLEISGANVTYAKFEVNRVVATGSCYGIMGTDSLGRDLWQGLLYGVKWALVIGLLTSILSTVMGAVYGVISGYYGGLKDEVMLRIAQIIYSLPVLPLLILLSYVLRPSIWNLILILVLFAWPGVSFVTRSMALQIKQSVYVEAARALGASDRRIILLYVFPQILPYLFASIALSVPGAILAEAGLSFLGLGDPYTLTWGKILYDAQRGGAVLSGMWWWVVPPGMAIALVGMTFVFIGNAIDAILNPKLKR